MKISKTNALLIGLFFTLNSITGQTINQVGSDFLGDANNDRCGSAVALSSDGNTFALGCALKQVNGLFSGQVSVYDYQSGSWSQRGGIIPGIEGGEQFGASVVISDDGNIVAVGAPASDVGGNSRGAVRIFEWDGTDWIQKGSQIGGDQNQSFLGGEIAISADGNILAVGASSYDGNGTTTTGLIRVFEFDGSDWVQLGEDFYGTTDDQIGTTISLSQDGLRMAVGISLSDSTNMNSGEVIVYDYADGVWTPVGNTLVGTELLENFGRSITISDDGSVLGVAGAGNGNIGYVNVYELDNSTWSQIGNTLTGVGGSDLFGDKIALDGAGQRIVISAPERLNPQDVGYVGIFDLVNGQWQQFDDYVFGVGDDDDFGTNLAISNDGGRFAVGALNNDTNANNAGMAQVYEADQLPNAICSDITISLDENGAASITPEDIDGGSSDANGDVTLSISQDTFTCDDIGDVVVTLTVTDSAGQSSSCSATVTLTDTTTPVIDCPEAQEVTIVEGETYTIEDFTGLASDNCSTGSDLVIVQDPVAGTEITEDTTIVITATDASNNTMSCSFELFVETTLSTTDNELLLLSGYPNPVQDYFTISNPRGIEIDTIVIYDLAGKLIKSYPTSALNSNYELDLKSLSSGLYVVKLSSSSEGASRAFRILKE